MIVVSATEKMLALYKGKLQAIDHQILLNRFSGQRGRTSLLAAEDSNVPAAFSGYHNADKT